MFVAGKVWTLHQYFTYWCALGFRFDWIDVMMSELLRGTGCTRSSMLIPYLACRMMGIAVDHAHSEGFGNFSPTRTLHIHARYAHQWQGGHWPNG